MALIHIQDYLQLLPAVNNTPGHAVWLHYDAQADVLYVNFTRPSVAADSELTDEDVILRYNEQDEIIGYTILHAKARGK